MKIAVIGEGIQGSAIVSVLAKPQGISVVYADIDLSEAKHA